MRKYLTKSVVDNAEASETGERWISDTKIRGFGLRIWRNNKNQVKKTFALRLTVNGKSKRRSFDSSTAFWKYYSQKKWFYSEEETGLSLYESISMGDLLEYAREWAQDEKDSLLGRPLIGGENKKKALTYLTVREEDEANRDFFRKIVSTFTFRRLKDIQIDRLKSKGSSESYTDRLDDIFERHFSDNLKNKLITAVTKQDISNELYDIQEVSTFKQLRAFTGKILGIPQMFGIRCQVTPYHTFEISTPNRTISFKETCEFEALTKILKWLERDEVNWQQAMALRLYFESFAPMSKVLEANWDQIFFSENESRDIRVFWRFGSKIRQRIPIRENTLDRLLVCIDKIEKDFGYSRYLFPSHNGRNKEHITNVTFTWRRCLGELGLPNLGYREYRILLRQNLTRVEPFEWPRPSNQDKDQRIMSKMSKIAHFLNTSE